MSNLRMIEIKFYNLYVPSWTNTELSALRRLECNFRTIFSGDLPIWCHVVRGKDLHLFSHAFSTLLFLYISRLLLLFPLIVLPIIFLLVLYVSLASLPVYLELFLDRFTRVLNSLMRWRVLKTFLEYYDSSIKVEVN